jgi:deoxyribonuclease-4
MSTAGGIDKALERGSLLGCRAVQIFTRSQLRWSSPELHPARIERFRELKGAFDAVFAHSSYLINLASADSTVFIRSVHALADELRRCRTLGLRLLVMHPGHHLGRGARFGIERLIQGIGEAYQLAGTPELQLALETTSGGGSSLGGRFEQLAELLEAARARSLPVGICFDTCHVFAAGYELRNSAGYRQTWERFDRLIGLRHLLAVHLNDSAGGLGSGRDRHRHIGEGQIGLDGFRLLVRDPHLERLPAVLETPKGKGLTQDAENLARLRSLERERTSNYNFP